MPSNSSKRSRSSPPKNQPQPDHEHLQGEDQDILDDPHEDQAEQLSLQTARLAQIASLSAHLAQLQATFIPPSSLVFQQTASTNQPKLAFTPSNATILAHEDALVKLLTQIDAVQSDGDAEIREKRKELVRAVDRELERIDSIKKDCWEKVQNGGVENAAALGAKLEQEQLLKEKRERVDRLFKNSSLNGGSAPPPAHNHVSGRQLNTPSSSQERDRHPKQPRYTSPQPEFPTNSPPPSRTGLPASPSVFKPATRTAAAPPPPPPSVPSPSSAHSTRRHGLPAEQPYFSSLPSRFSR